VRNLLNQGYSLQYDRPSLLVFGNGYYFENKDGRKFRIVGVSNETMELKATNGKPKRINVDIAR